MPPRVTKQRGANARSVERADGRRKRSERGGQLSQSEGRERRGAKWRAGAPPAARWGAAVVIHKVEERGRTQNYHGTT